MTRDASFLAAWLLIVAVARSESSSAGEHESPVSQPSPKLGTVEGIVRYRTDSKRPWRFTRYYVRSANDNSMAEAVVALAGSSLAASAPSNTPESHSIGQVNYQFVPETMAVRVGDSIRVLNSDDALHNVMTLDGGKPFNVTVTKGGEFTHTFNQAGGLRQPVRLSCAFHGGMRARIYVFDHPWFKVTARDGRFRFENVPAGEYKRGVIHPAGKLRRSRRVEVKPDEKRTLEIVLSPEDLIGAEAKND